MGREIVSLMRVLTATRSNVAGSLLHIVPRNPSENDRHFSGYFLHDQGDGCLRNVCSFLSYYMAQRPERQSYLDWVILESCQPVYLVL